ncbi:MAG: hypothetical protein ACRC4W_01560 [Treponemataceae bacterium]
MVLQSILAGDIFFFKIIDFFDDALLSKSGSEMYTELKKFGLKGFEDIQQDIIKLNSNYY